MIKKKVYEQEPQCKWHCFGLILDHPWTNFALYYNCLITVLYSMLHTWYDGFYVTVNYITNHASRLVCRNNPEINWPPQSMYYA